MKQLQIWGLLLLVVGSLYSCKMEESSHENPKEEPVAAPQNIISVEEAEELYTTYGTDRVPVIEAFQNMDTDGNPIDPNSPEYVRTTRSLSIGYDDLKTYLKFIEQQADSANTPITGIRIYFGKYKPGMGQKGNTETVFLNPLMEYGESNVLQDDISFAVVRSGGATRAVAVGELLGTTNEQVQGKANYTLLVQEEVQSLALNDMPRRPPPPPPSDPDY